jgi:SPP1 gp7 family putative phage head morphogenesis protein
VDPSKVFDLEAEQEAFSKAVLPTVTNVYETFGEGTSESLGVAFNLRDENVARDILERDNRLRGTVETTWHAVQEAIIDGEALGEGIDGIAKRIGHVFEQAKGYRARMIARTETIGASNAASLQAADASGVVGKKTWLAASDPRTRASHVSADGQTVDVKKAFQVGASSMMHPGDPNGGARETVNCRCSMIFERLPEAEIPVEEPEIEDLDARAARVEDAVAAGRAQGLETHRLHHARPEAPEGFYTRARLQEQEDLLDELWEGAANVPNEGEALFSGGLGGAGKGTVLRSADAGIDSSRFFTIDPDAIKEAMARRGMIPTVEGFEDLSPMELSALIHEESSHLAARLAQRSVAERKNVIFDITMSSKNSVVKRLDMLRQAGYDQIDMIFVDIDVETSVARALARWERGLAEYADGNGYGGRYVPPEIIRAQYDEVWGSVNRGVFEDLKDQATSWKLFDNTGDAPRLVAFSDDLAERAVTRTGVDLLEQMPTGLTRSEREEWFVAKWGKVESRTYGDLEMDPVLGYTRKVILGEKDRVISWEGMTGLDAHEALIRRVDRLFTNRPDVADRIPRVGTFEGLGIRTRSANVMGQASRDDYMALRAKTIATMEDAQNLHRREKASGWWSSDDPFAIVDHEFGHHVHYFLERHLETTFSGSFEKGLRDFLKPILKEVSGLKGNVSPASGQGLQWVRENLSKYGTTNAYETFAEAWAEYSTMGDAARPFAKAVGEAVEARLDEVARTATVGP